jgi:hypothetical protein
MAAAIAGLTRLRHPTEHAAPEPLASGGTGTAVRLVMATVICCSGIMRSASTWSYNVCRELSLRSQIRGSEVTHYGYSNQTDETIREWAAIEKKRGIIVRGVMKAHVIAPGTRRLIARGKIANVFTIRDPRDAMSSMLRFGQEKSEKEKSFLLEYFCYVLKQGLAFLEDGHSLVIRYEEMVDDPAAKIRAIARYLGRPIGEQALSAAAQAAGVKRARAIVARLEAEAQPGEDHFDGHSQLHVGHLNGGTIGRWRDELDADFKARVEEAFAPYLAAYGYDGSTG